MKEETSDGIAFLTERIDAVERERDALLERSQLLEQLARSFVDVIAARDERELASQALRAAVVGLGFTRSIWFRIEGAHAMSALYELDGPSVTESEYGGTLPEGSTLYRVTTGDSDIVTGWASDADAPLFDTRRRFAAASVRAGSGDAYLFYADGSNDRGGSSWSLNSMRELALHASFALERMRLSAELERLAMHDSLTGLFNRRALMERLAAELRTINRTGETLAFAMIDIDDFKHINDTRGHAGGDAALVTVATVLRTQTRDIDVPARFAGDEFSLILPRTDRDAAQAALKRILDALRTHALSASIGAAFATPGMPPSELMRRADDAVYQAKAAGKNCYCLAD
ncbi:MAG TPA: GGDEF domain-containing protein [Candidatus Baltobacteraceae bacterium]|nr:GGDEF domain-containing protein [Candidatus Baltobacteraceae bacterium]